MGSSCSNPKQETAGTTKRLQQNASGHGLSVSHSQESLCNHHQPAAPESDTVRVFVELGPSGVQTPCEVGQDEYCGRLKSYLFEHPPADGPEIPPPCATRLIFANNELGNGDSYRSSGVEPDALLQLEFGEGFNVILVPATGQSHEMQVWKDESVANMFIRASNQIIGLHETFRLATLSSSFWQLQRVDSDPVTNDDWYNADTLVGDSAMRSGDSLVLTERCLEGIMRPANNYGLSGANNRGGMLPEGSQLNNRVDNSKFMLQPAEGGVVTLEFVTQWHAKLFVGVGPSGINGGMKAVLTSDTNANHLRVCPARNGRPAPWFSLESAKHPGFLLNHCNGVLWFFDHPANNEQCFQADSSWRMPDAGDKSLSIIEHLMYQKV